MPTLSSSNQPDGTSNQPGLIDCQKDEYIFLRKGAVGAQWFSTVKHHPEVKFDERQLSHFEIASA
jgi:hypothetical protein